MKKGIAVTSSVFILVTGITAIFGFGFAVGVIDNFLGMESDLQQSEQLHNLHDSLENACSNAEEFGTFSDTTEEYEFPYLVSLGEESNRFRAEFEEDGETEIWGPEPVEGELVECDLDIQELTEEGAYRFEIESSNGENPTVQVEPVDGDA